MLQTLRRRAVPALGALALAATIPVGLAEAKPDRAAEDGPRTVLRTALAGSLVPDPELFGVKPGTSTWVLRRGSARLAADGRLTVRVRRLVIPDPPANGTNPVPTLSAGVFCNGVRVATTATVPFSREGDAELDQDLGELPSPCVAPAVLVHPNAVTARYIAFGGSR